MDEYYITSAVRFYKVQQELENVVGYYKISWYVGDRYEECYLRNPKATDDLYEILIQRKCDIGDVHSVRMIGYAEECYF